MPILGSVDQIGDLRIPFDEIIICIPSATSDEMRRIIAICKLIDKPYRTVPTFSELIDSKVSIKSVREISIIDLLGRKEIQLNRNLSQITYMGRKCLSLELVAHWV